MEVEVLNTQGIPKGSIVMIRAGQMRRQAKLDARLPFQFPCLPLNANPFRVEIFQPLGSKSIPVSPDRDQYQVHLPATDIADKSVLDLQITDVATTTTEPTASDDPVTAGNTVLDGEQTQKASTTEQAKNYLQQHRLLGFMQEMLATVLTEKPSDPFGYMSACAHNRISTGKTVNDTITTAAPASGEAGLFNEPEEDDDFGEEPTDPMHRQSVMVNSSRTVANLDDVVDQWVTVDQRAINLFDENCTLTILTNDMEGCIRFEVLRPSTKETLFAVSTNAQFDALCSEVGGSGTEQIDCAIKSIFLENHFEETALPGDVGSIFSSGMDPRTVPASVTPDSEIAHQLAAFAMESSTVAACEKVSNEVSNPAGQAFNTVIENCESTMPPLQPHPPAQPRDGKQPKRPGNGATAAAVGPPNDTKTKVDLNKIARANIMQGLKNGALEALVDEMEGMEDESAVTKNQAQANEMRNDGNAVSQSKLQQSQQEEEPAITATQETQATKIQAGARGLIARKATRELAKKQEEEAANTAKMEAQATKIQAGARGLLARKQTRGLANKQEDSSADAQLVEDSPDAEDLRQQMKQLLATSNSNGQLAAALERIRGPPTAPPPTPCASTGIQLSPDSPTAPPPTPASNAGTQLSTGSPTAPPPTPASNAGMQLSPGSPTAPPPTPAANTGMQISTGSPTAPPPTPAAKTGMQISTGTPTAPPPTPAANTGMQISTGSPTAPPPTPAGNTDMQLSTGSPTAPPPTPAANAGIQLSTGSPTAPPPTPAANAGMERSLGPPTAPPPTPAAPAAKQFVADNERIIADNEALRAEIEKWEKLDMMLGGTDEVGSPAPPPRMPIEPLPPAASPLPLPIDIRQMAAELCTQVNASSTAEARIIALETENLKLKEVNSRLFQASKQLRQQNETLCREVHSRAQV